MQLLSEYDGSVARPMTKTARAYLNECGVASADFYVNGILVDTREFLGHNLRYAEDAAENYMVGVLSL